MPVEAEVPGDFHGEHRGLAGGDEQAATLRAQLFEQRADAVERTVLVQAGDAKTLAVVMHRLPGALLVHPVAAHEALQQRRADEMLQGGQVRLVNAQLRQRVLHRAGDAFAGVGEGAVEVEEDGVVVHQRS